MHPKAQLNGTCSVQSLDEPIGFGEADEPLTLGDSLAARTEDPSVTATRRLDWEPLVASLDPQPARFGVLGPRPRSDHFSVKLKRSRSAIQTHKERLAQLVREHLGEDILVRVQESPAGRTTSRPTGKRRPAVLRQRWPRARDPS